MKIETRGTSASNQIRGAINLPEGELYEITFGDYEGTIVTRVHDRLLSISPRMTYWDSLAINDFLFTRLPTGASVTLTQE